MNPQEFEWTDSQQVTITNPTAKDFTWKVYGKEYRLPAGRSANVPGYIAWLYVYNQATVAAQRDGVWSRWTEPETRKEYFAKFVVGIQPLVQEIELEPDPVELVDEDDDTDIDGQLDNAGNDTATPPLSPKKTKDKVNVGGTNPSN